MGHSYDRNIVGALQGCTAALEECSNLFPHICTVVRVRVTSRLFNMPRPSTRRLSLRIERQFNAPVTRVWKAWTHRTEMAKWFGEGAERARVQELDARPGGRLRITFPSGPGRERAWNYFGLFLSVRPTRELVLVVIDAPSRWAETVRVSLQARRRGTRMIFESSLALASARAATRQGWSAAFDRLADAIGDAG